jgi:uncharacterized protein YidB (DUF937 family)
MTLFENLVPELQQRTRRRDDVERLLEALLAEITDPARGGLEGFLAHFTAAGFSGLVQSWLEHDAYAIASAAQIRYALGDALLKHLASAAGVSAGSAAMMLALMIPGVVHRLTPGGRVPSPRELNDLVEGRLGSTSVTVREHLDANAVEATPRTDAPTEHAWMRRLRTPAVMFVAPIVWLLLIALAAWWSLR